MSNVNSKMAKGAVWMVLFKLVERSLGLISTIILARLLVPADFGLIAMAMSIIAILELLGAFGFDMALIQNAGAKREDYNTAWTFNVLFGLVSALIVIALAIPAAAFYAEPRLENLIYVLALGLAVQGFENIGIVAFRKQLEFNKEFKFQITKKLASFIVTVFFAYYLHSYWALVAGMLTGRIFGVFLSYYSHPYRPWFSLRARHELFHFSKWLFFNNVLLLLRTRSIDFIIGKTSGAHGLGLFSIAHEVSSLPSTELIAPINRAVFPGYAKMSHDTCELRNGFLKVFSVIVMFALPAGAGIAVTADLIVAVLLGPKWLETVPLIQILAFYGIVSAMQTNTIYIHLAVGKPKVTSYLFLAQAIIQIPLLVWLSIEHGVTGAAWGVLGVSVLVLPANLYLVSHRLDLSFRDLASILWRPVVAVVAMFFVVEYALSLLRGGAGILGDLVLLLFGVGLGAVVFIVAVLGLWLLSARPDGAEQYLLENIKYRLQRVFA